MSKSGRITIRELARLAGVDKSIVSKVVNGVSAGQVSAVKQARIESLIQEHHYVPQNAARSLARRCNHQLAFLLTGPTQNSFANSAFSQILSGFAQQCRNLGYQCQVLSIESAELSAFLQPENLYRLGIDGCVLAGTNSELCPENLTAIRMPFLLLGWEYLRDVLPVISRDSSREYREMLDYGYSLGHRHIMYDSISPISQARFQKLAVHYPGVSVESCPADSQLDEFALAARQASAYAARPAGERPTLLWGSDHFCCSFATHLRQFGFSCPGDISIVSYSESWSAACYNPPLTTYSLDFRQWGSTAVEVILQIINGGLDLAASIELANHHIPRSIWQHRQSVCRLS
ncbi:MAG: LacI family transcriptional regulator [Oligosphaeraceae bacterium]|nr:LacI family transcriptional regulator [Oligosphaeraceae bacterium]